ncbi:16S rRNA (cytosine(1402)-N(4))-methyltransferase RsmH [Caproiciproducens sp. NJN-50]|uniref:16S rRNA (cytosine(1402)-N(4))-methyltransferase RsmH n=1 Tax=Acutalibacteraceae TaxID=3082771 RepID=UPI000FFE1781|nr:MULTISPECIES: 16S rRNA (cytosine(1402)-N(4))-methyltransferase RsmH [Acutalibacteraceae]QAT50148.1 16S rRNA (cytosine(1402)-N(4))-methyltransferase RsmH [Caproiciproducens sp. NJN-50]
MEFYHKPVLFDETIESLNIRPDGIYIDGTAGGGGHSLAIAKRLKTGKLLAIDQDPDAVKAAGGRLKDYPCATVYRTNFSLMDKAARRFGLVPADGVLLDIGVSSFQLDDPARGFSYHSDAPLDMRMSREGVSARDLVNSLSERELEEILYKYGEESNARRIAAGIVKAREEAPVETTLQLADIVKNSVPAAVRRKPGHPARKTFQALRIRVNGELDRLSEGLDAAFSILKPGGRLAVITFHSLEDRMVKKRMADWCTGCTCPPDFPVCVCGKKPRAELLYKKGISPSEQELEENPRSRSARLRVCIKLEETEGAD